MLVRHSNAFICENLLENGHGRSRNQQASRGSRNQSLNRGQKSKKGTNFEASFGLLIRASHFLIYHSFFPFPLFFHCIFFYSFLINTRSVFNTYHLFRRFCPLSRRTINFPDLNPDHDRHRPLPLPRWLCTTRRARKCGLYKLRAPLFTGLTTYLRELDPSIQSRYLVRLSLSLPMSCTSRPPRVETYQTLSLAVFMPHILLLSFYRFYFSCRFIRVSHADVASE